MNKKLSMENRKNIHTTKLLSFLLLMVSVYSLKAQDIITLKSGDELNTKVLKVGAAEIEYKKSDNLSGPIYTIPLREVFMIKYQNGAKDIFNKTTIATPTSIGSSSTSSVVVPEFVNVPVYFDSTSNSHKRFEQPFVNFTTRLTGLVSAEAVVVLTQLTSTVRFKAGSIPKFYVKVMGSDPTSTIRLFELYLNKGKNQRELVLSKSGLGNAGSRLTPINLDYKNMGGDVYEIAIQTPLTKGEYSFADVTNEKNPKAYCFTVYEDADNGQTQGMDMKEIKKQQKEGTPSN